MACPGLHCPGCSGGQSLVILGGAAALIVLAAQAVPWVAERIWWIGGTAAVCFAVSVAACVWLAGLTERREARFAAMLATRHDPVLPQRAMARQLPRTAVPAVEPARWPVRVIPDHAVRVLPPVRKQVER